MSRKEIEESQQRFVRAKPPEPKRGKPIYIDNANVNQNNLPHNEPIEFHFKESGRLTEDTVGSYAMKREYPNGRKEYYVKFATAGSGVGRMLNPWGVYYKDGDDVKYEKTMGRKRYEFKKVQENIFDSYMNFLRTRNERYILVAEREVNNG